MGGPGGLGSMTPPRRVGVPPVSRGGQAVAERLDRHFATLVDAPAARSEDGATEAVDLMTDLLPRTGSARRRGERALWLRAPFRRLRRLIGL
jgi:hypothetical protein